jgi:hypothetical protein
MMSDLFDASDLSDLKAVARLFMMSDLSDASDLSDPSL